VFQFNKDLEWFTFITERPTGPVETFVEITREEGKMHCRLKAGMNLATGKPCEAATAQEFCNWLNVAQGDKDAND
jgi:hypothetical protein